MKSMTKIEIDGKSYVIDKSNRQGIIIKYEYGRYMTEIEFMNCVASFVLCGWIKKDLSTIEKILEMADVTINSVNVDENVWLTISADDYVKLLNF